MYNLNNTEKSSSFQSGQRATGRLALVELRNLVIVLSCSFWASMPLWAAEEFGKAQTLATSIGTPDESNNVSNSMMHVDAAHAPAQAGDSHELKDAAQLAGTESQNMGVIKASQDALRHVALTAVASANSVALVVGSAATVATNKVLDVADVVQHGIASWYGANFQNKRTANGERFNMNELTAAHRTLPFGTKVCAHSPSTGKSVIVRINDRGPVAKDRIIDFSKAAAQALGILHSGSDVVALLDSSDMHCAVR